MKFRVPLWVLEIYYPYFLFFLLLSLLFVRRPLYAEETMSGSVTWVRQTGTPALLRGRSLSPANLRWM